MKLEPLDPRFGKLVALMESSSHEGERSSARARAEVIVKPIGGFDRALRILAYERVRAANPNNPFAGFDEFQEIDNPGHMAQQRAAREEGLKRWHERRAALVERYGTLDAVVEPCVREKAIMAAVKQWRVPSKRPHQRWTWDLKGWEASSLVEKMPPALRAAVEGATPMPTTYAEACAELAYWRERNEDMEHALGENGRYGGDYGLDRVAVCRMEIIRELVEHEIRLTTLPDIVERFRMYRQREIDERHVEEALFRDLEALVRAEATPWVG